MDRGKLRNGHLLVIGAGIGQVPIIKKAQEKRVYTTVVSIPGSYPGLHLADDVLECDIYDMDRIVEWAYSHGVTAVISDQNDLTNPTVAYVAEKLGLPGNTHQQVLSYSNKNRYKELCDKIGNPVPRHIAVHDVDFEPMKCFCPFPWIVKPADSQSSIAVRKVFQWSEAKEALREALDVSKTHTAIIEEFFQGEEVVCEGFIERGTYYLLKFADRKYFSSISTMIPSQTLFPSLVQSEILNQILACEKRMAAYVAPSFGIVHSEYLVNRKTGEIRAIDSALRGGGMYISSHLIPMATGIDVNELLLDMALGKEVNVRDLFARRRDRSAGYLSFYLPSGIITKVFGLKSVAKLSFVTHAFLNNIKIGESVEEMTYKGQRRGPILLYADNRAQLDEHILQVKGILDVVVTNKDGRTSGILWD